MVYDFTLREHGAQYHTRERVHGSQYDVTCWNLHTVFWDEAVLEWCQEQCEMIQHNTIYTHNIYYINILGALPDSII